MPLVSNKSGTLLLGVSIEDSGMIYSLLTIMKRLSNINAFSFVDNMVVSNAEQGYHQQGGRSQHTVAFITLLTSHSHQPRLSHARLSLAIFPQNFKSGICESTHTMLNSGKVI